jgi:hypothetical protein
MCRASDDKTISLYSYLPSFQSRLVDNVRDGGGVWVESIERYAQRHDFGHGEEFQTPRHAQKGRGKTNSHL